MPNKNAAKRPAAPGGLDIAAFTPQQNQALLDLLVLAMYRDGNLAKVEENRVQQLLAAMGFETEYDRNREFDASVTRIRRQSQTPEAVKAVAAKLAGNFAAKKDQQSIYGFLSDLTAMDGSVSTEENQFLSAVKEAFKM
jgi:hypothetical protein